MLRNYFKTAIRNLVRNKMYSIINILGLAIGLAAVFIIAIYLKHELSYDKFLKKSDSIVRLVIKSERDNHETPNTTEFVAHQTQRKIPEIEAATRIFRYQSNQLQHNKNVYGYYKTLYADSSFLKVFPFKSLSGDPGKLALENTAVISEEVKTEIFGSGPALNKVIKMGENEFVVAAVIENPPENFHINFDILFSFASLSDKTLKMNGFDFPTYFLLKENLSPSLEEKITSYISGDLNEKFKKFEITVSSYLQPVENIHLGKELGRGEYAITGDRNQIYIFGVVALFILIIAVFNFMNLFTAQSETRLKEVGVRKVIGSKRKQVVLQFVGESVIIALFAFLLSMLLIESFLPHFSNMLAIDFGFSYSADLVLIFIFLLFSVLVGILSSWYPALYVSSFNTVKIFKGNSIKGSSSDMLRKTLVVLQFTLSVGLITSIIVLYSQVNYLKNKDVGFDKDNVAFFYGLTSKIQGRYKSLKEELLKNPRLASVTASMTIPANKRSPMTLRLPHQKPAEAFNVEENRVQPGYLETYGIKLIKGKDFTEPHNENDILINETAANMLGLDNPTGEEVFLWKRKCRIIGVVKDYNFRSLHKSLGPLVLSNYKNQIFCISARSNGKFNKELLNYIQEVFSQYDPGYRFKYQFIDQRFANLYKKEEKLNSMILIAAVLGIVLSVVGLYAYVALIVNRKTKEMGIRKVFGASPRSISFSIFKSLFQWIMIATLSGWAIAYLFSDSWLKNFPYTIELKPWMFLLSALFVGLLAAISVMYKTLQLSWVNPATALKDE